MVFRLALLIILVWAASVQAESPEAEARRARVQELTIQESQNRERIRELGGSAVSATAKRAIVDDIRMLEDKADRLFNIVDDLTKTRAELRELERRTAEGEDLTLAALTGVAVGVVRNQAIKKTLEKAGKKAMGKAFGTASLAGAAAGYVGAKIARHLNARDIRELVDQEQVRLLDVLQLVSALRKTRNFRAEQLAEVIQLEIEQESILEEVSRLNKLLEQEAKPEAKPAPPLAREEALLDRDTDAEGDAELQRQSDFDNASRLCDPSRRGLKGKVGEAGKLPSHEETTAAALNPCRVIDGKWLLQYTKSANRLPVEISHVKAADDDAGAAVRFELVGKHGLQVRCQAQGYNLACEIKVPPPPTCPGVAWTEWRKEWTMQVPTDGLEITGTRETFQIIINPPFKPCRLAKPPIRLIQEFRLTPQPGSVAPAE